MTSGQRVSLFVEWGMKKTYGEIYLIRWDGGCYVGQSSGGSISRWQQHVDSLRRGTHLNKDLVNQYVRWGIGVFTFQVLESNLPLEGLDDREDYWHLRLGAVGPRPRKKVKEDRIVAVLEMLRAKKTHCEIRDTLGTSMGTISRIRHARLF